jgi:HK97 family phage prohead protease
MPRTVTPDGVFTGYASLWGRPDLQKDVVEPGAFRRALASRGPGGVRLLWQHDAKAPIGVWLDMAEDARGLRVTGRLAAGSPKAREVAALIEAGAVDGLSIGFAGQGARRDPRTGLRRLAEIDLWEVSIVTFPMLPGARIARPGPALDLKRFDPSQPRKPVGQSDGGQWARVDGPASAARPAARQQLAQVIRVCILSGAARFSDGTYSATYDCRGGRSFTRRGVGSPPGLVRDPYR